jgi:hypothetical protein
LNSQLDGGMGTRRGDSAAVRGRAGRSGMRGGTSLRERAGDADAKTRKPVAGAGALCSRAGGEPAV